MSASFTKSRGWHVSTGSEFCVSCLSIAVLLTLVFTGSSLMNRLGPKNPFFVILLIVATQLCFYLVMWATGTSLEQAQEAHWFWSKEELTYDKSSDSSTGWLSVLHTSALLPPAPFGSWGAVLAGHVNWRAVGQGLENMAALAFLYLLRSSIHASAMKKNVGNLVRRIPVQHDQSVLQDTTVRMDNTHERRHSLASDLYESVKIVNMSLADKKTLKNMHPKRYDSGDLDLTIGSGWAMGNGSNTQQDYTEIRAKMPRRTLEEIFVEYGYALFVVAGFGGFGVCPTVATSNTSEF